LLPEAMIPSSFQFLDALPVGPSGKLDRAALPAPGASQPSRRRRPPGDALEWRLAAEWCAVLGGAEVSPEDHFLLDLGGHSLDALRLVGRLSRQWPGCIRLSDFLREPTIAGVAILLRARTAPDQGAACGEARGVVPLVPDGDGRPIVLVHPAVGTVLCFVGLAKCLGALDPAVRGPVWGLEAPGFDGRNAPIASVEALARWHCENLLPRLAGQAPVLVGYSFGGLVAFEMAAQLAAGGLTPAHLVILDTPAPADQHGPVPDDLTLTIDIAHLLERYDGRPPSDFGGRLGGVPEAARVLEARAILLSTGVLGGAIEALDFAALVAVARAALVARAAFRPQPYAGAVTVLRAATPATADILGVDPGILADPAFGWRDLVSGDLTTDQAPGDHVSVILPPGVDKVAAVLGRLSAAR
jgi:thioesterase domain-containing protein